MVLRLVWIWPLDLYKTFGAYGLVATARLVDIGRIKHEADGAFLCILV
jgi:hypothetical protein